MKPSTDREQLCARHLRFGWGFLFVFLCLGLALEALHALKLDLYLAPRNEVRRLMWTLAHAHGTLLSMLHLLFGLTIGAMHWNERQLALASRCLGAATVLLPGGFFLGGLWTFDGDPGLGVLLAPAGGLLLLIGVGLAFLNAGGPRRDRDSG